jgi:transposase
MNHLGIDDVGKRKCRAVAIKDDRGQLLDEFFFGNDGYDIQNLLLRIQTHGKCVAVLESTGNMWIRIHNTIHFGSPLSFL